MAQSRFTYFTFHLLTFSSMVKLHITPVTASCHFDKDAYCQYANLIARGRGTVPIYNLTCICFVGTPKFSILYPAADDSPDPQITISPPKCQGVASCIEMPQTCADINDNVFSYLSISGILNKTAVITCKSTRDSNRADPFIVWVEPAVTSIPSSSNMTKSSIMTTTTITISSQVSSSPEMSTSIDYSTSVSPTTTAVTSQPLTETLSTRHSLSATPSPPTTPLPTVNPDDHRIITTTSTPRPPPVPTAVVSAALVVVTMMIMIVVVLIVVLKKRQKQVERDYKIPPPNTELQESIMLKNNAAN